MLARCAGSGDRMALISPLTAILDRQAGDVRWAASQLERVRDRQGDRGSATLGHISLESAHALSTDARVTCSGTGLAE